MSGTLSDVTTERWMQRERQLAQSVGELAIQSKSIEVNSADNLVVRNIIPAVDLNSGADNDWSDDTEASSTHGWLQDFSTGGGSNDSYNQAYVIDSDSLSEDKVMGIMGLSFLHSDVQTRQIRFNMGRNGNQGVKREMSVESAETDEEGRAMFLTDLLFDAKEHGTIEFYEEEAKDGNRVMLHGYVAEAVGETIAEASNPLHGRGR